MIDKTANTDYEIHEVLKKRWSPRAFKDKPIETEKIKNMLEAARWSPSSSNEQPWRFIIGLHGDETYKKIYDILVKFNQKWAGTAPVLMLAIGYTQSKKEPGEPSKIYKYDVGQAVAHLTFQATADGLYVHQMGGLKKKKAALVFEVPKEYKVLTAIAVGYIGNPEVLPTRMAKSEYKVRERQNLKEMVFAERFGQNPDFLHK